jgi:hypothetical protein
MISDQEKIVRMLTMLLPYAKVYVVKPYALEHGELDPALDLAIDAEEKLPQTQLIYIRNILESLNLSRAVHIFDLMSLPEEKRAEVLKDAIPWKN